MRIRRIAILIDGGFFVKRLPKILGKQDVDTPEQVAEWARILCKRHVQRLIGEAPKTKNSRWLDHVYRLFYYDALPFEGTAHHPITNTPIQFGKSPQAEFRQNLFKEIRKKRKFALRLGRVGKEGEWRIAPRLTKPLLKTREWLPLLECLLKTPPETSESLTPDQLMALGKLVSTWKDLKADDVTLGLRQKGVDMRIGVDIASLTLKEQVDTVILVTGDSDFVPAAKLARREGVEFILDPMWQNVSEDLFEHIDGLISVLNARADEKASDA